MNTNETFIRPRTAVHRMRVPWTEAGATWNCPVDKQPANGSAECAPRWNGGSFVASATAVTRQTRTQRGWVRFDVTADVALFVTRTANQGWLLKKVNEAAGGRADYTSREGAEKQRPRLVVVSSVADTTPPVISRFQPSNGSFVSAVRPAVTCAFADDLSEVRPSWVQLFVNGVDRTVEATISAAGLTWTAAADLLPGAATVRVTAADLVGNQAEATWTFGVDPLPPTLDLAIPAAQTTIEEPTYAIQVFYADAFSSPDLSTLRVVVAGVDVSAACVTSVSVATCETQALVSGQHTVTAEIRDLAGNVTALSRVLDVIVDLAPPVLTLVAPADGAFVRTASALVSGTVSDDGTLVSVLVNGIAATLAAGGYSATISLEEGANGILVLAADSTGKQSVVFATVFLDTQPPSLAIEAPVGQVTNEETIRIAGTAADTNDIARVDIDGAAVVLTNGRFEDSRRVVDGINPFTVRAVDVAGNETTAQVEISYLTLPEVAITAPADLSWIAATTADVIGTVGAGVTSVTVNGVGASLAGSSFTALGVPLTEGGNLITATATGAGGRVATDTVSIVRDLQPPRVVVYGPEDGSVVTTAQVAVFGLVNDIVPGTVNASEVSVTVNGRAAEVSNRSFLLPDLSVALGQNSIAILARDESGNESTALIEIERRDPAGSSRLEILSGDRQAGVIGTALSAPLVVRAVNGAGLGLASVPVLFKVSGNNGSLDGDRRQIAVLTDATGQAQAHFSLGTRAGVASQRVEAKVVGVGEVLFLTDALSGSPTRIVVDAGDQQVGVAGQELPRPLIAVVTDEGHNRLEAIPVRFRAVKGRGRFANGQPEITVATDSDGRAIVPFRLEPDEGTANNVVTARIDSLPAGPFAGFVASGWASGELGETSISGVVLDNSNLPVNGVTIRIKDTPLIAQTNSDGFFRVQPASVGSLYVIVDGSTVTRRGSWPDLEFVMTTIAGRDNTLGMPIFLLPLSLGQGILVDETRGGQINLPEVPGFALEILPGSVTFPGGSRSGFVSVTAVHSDKVPMVPNFGQQPRFIVTIQPAGARFDPPARLTLPNLEGLAPGEVTEMYSFDHDLGHFVSIGPATVSEDGSTMVANPGVGVIKAGWHCGGNAPFTGSSHDCPICHSCIENWCTADDLQPCSNDDPCMKNSRCSGGLCKSDPVSVKILSVDICATANVSTELGPGNAVGSFTLSAVTPAGTAHEILQAERRGGTYTDVLDFSVLPPWTKFERIRAEWRVGACSKRSEALARFTPLGTFKHSQYNCPEEADLTCTGTPEDVCTAATPGCVFTPASMSSVFVEKVAGFFIGNTGCGKSIENGKLMSSATCTEGTWPFPAECAFKSRFQRVSEYEPLCRNWPLDGRTVAANDFLRDKSRLPCGSRVCIRLLGGGVEKTVTDRCPDCTNTQLDNFSLQTTCTGVLDLTEAATTIRLD